MKKVLLSFLMLLMLTPGLACAMPSCFHHEEIQASLDKPCHDDAEQGEKHHGPMTNADCAKTDLQNVVDQIVKKSDLSAQAFFPPPVKAAMPQQAQLAENSKIRSPPPDWPGLFETSPSVLLTTQRIRL